MKIDAAPISTASPDIDAARMGELLVRLREHAAAIESAARRDCAIAVLVPCYNEAATVERVVADFRAALPTATIYVYDNNSKDGTAELAAQAGAVVRRETRQGKGNVVRRMFADIEADVYVLVDGDATYDAAAAPRLVTELLSGPFDKVNGARVHLSEAAYRPGHVFGNRLLSGLVGRFFGTRSKDMLSGYKVLSRRFVKSFPAKSSGFEIETELLVHALELDVPMSEIDTDYRERPPGSQSKLSTFRDGWRILNLILHLVRDLKPLQFFGTVAGGLMAISLVLAGPIVVEYLNTGLVPRLPTAVLSVGFMLSGLFSFFAGLILDSVARGRREAKLMAYLAHPAADQGRGGG